MSRFTYDQLTVTIDGKSVPMEWLTVDAVALRCEGAEAVVLSRPLLHREFVAEVGHE